MISPNPVRENPSLVTSQLSSKLDESPRPYNPTLPTIPEIVDIKINNDIKSLTPAFDSAQIPWIEHGYKTRFNKEYQQLGKVHAYLTRTRRKSSLLVKLADILKLLYLTRTRDISAIRTRLALLEISHRRRCAGKVGVFCMGEMRALLGDTRITETEILKIVRSPKIEVDVDELDHMLWVLGQDNMSREVWIPRRLVRHLAAEGSRLEIATMLVMMIRRMHGRFNRARVSARMVAVCADCNEKHVRAAIMKLQEKRLLMKNRQAERWSVNRWGSLYDFPEDLSIDPNGTAKPVRAAPSRAKKGFAACLYGTVFAALAATTYTAQAQKGANLINPDPSLQLEPQLLMQKPPVSAGGGGSGGETDRKRLAAAASALVFDRGPQGMAYQNTFSNVHSAAAAAEVLELRGWGSFQRYRQGNEPHIPKQAPWQRKRA